MNFGVQAAVNEIKGSTPTEAEMCMCQSVLVCVLKKRQGTNDVKFEK